MSGSSSFPTSVDTKTALTDGIDIIQADDVNNAYVPQTATQTFIGASGAAQSKNTDILAFLEAIRTTISLTWIDANTVRASAGLIYCKNSGGTIRVLRKNTSTTDITFSDIDTGSRAVSTRYYVWANADATASTVTFKISTSSSSPSGVTLYGLVGNFMTNATGSGNIIQNSVTGIKGIKQVGFKYVSSGAVQSGTGTIADDDTIPQNTEGVALSDLDLIYAAQSTSNLLFYTAVINVHSTVGQGTPLFLALFKDSTADAVAATWQSQVNNSYQGQNIVLRYLAAPSSVNAITYKLRAGTATSGNVTMNGYNGSRKLGGVALSSVTIEEFELV